MKFAVYFRASLRVSFITDKESIALAHARLTDANGQRIYGYQSLKDGDEYEVPFIG